MIWRRIIKQFRFLLKKIDRDFGYGWLKIWERCSIEARQAFYSAEREAEELGHNFITPEHLLLGLIVPDNLGADILRLMGINLEVIYQKIKEAILQNKIIVKQKQQMYLTPQGKRVIELACIEADELNDDYIGTEHLLLAILQEKGIITQIFNEWGFELEDIRRIIRELRKGDWNND